MPLEFTCDCGKTLKAPETLAGKRGKCPRCDRVFIVPSLPSPRPAALLSAATVSPTEPLCLAETSPATRTVSQPAAPAILAAVLGRQQLLAEAQVVPDAERCVQCGICSYNCPMGIDVRAHAWRGLPIHDSHCLTCSQCVNHCPRGVLRFDDVPLFPNS